MNIACRKWRIHAITTERIVQIKSKDKFPGRIHLWRWMGLVREEHPEAGIFQRGRHQCYPPGIPLYRWKGKAVIDNVSVTAPSLSTLHIIYLIYSCIFTHNQYYFCILFIYFLLHWWPDSSVMSTERCNGGNISIKCVSNLPTVRKKIQLW